MTGHCPVFDKMNDINRYRKNSRLKDFDYSQPGYYFVTLCTKDKINYFGKVTDSEISLNRLGKIAEYNWEQIPKHYQNVQIDTYIIMPNHIHGIIIINEAQIINQLKFERSSTIPRYGLLSKIINSYKNIVTKTIKSEFGETQFRWQRSFYEHIIRSENSLSSIREYILQNPLKLLIEYDMLENL